MQLKENYFTMFRSFRIYNHQFTWRRVSGYTKHSPKNFVYNKKNVSESESAVVSSPENDCRIETLWNNFLLIFYFRQWKSKLPAKFCLFVWLVSMIKNCSESTNVRSLEDDCRFWIIETFWNNFLTIVFCGLWKSK